MDDREIKYGFLGERNLKAQAAIEFSLAFICLAIFLVATSKIFIWFGNNIVQRHVAYEQTRVAAGDSATTQSAAVQNFYDQSAHPLNIYAGW